MSVRWACGSPNSKAWEEEWKKNIYQKSLFLSLPQYPGLSKLDKGNDSALNHQMSKKQIWVSEKHKGVHKHPAKSTASISSHSSSQDLPMDLVLTWDTPSTLIRGTALQRQSTGTLPACAGSCVKNSSNKSLLWEGDQQSHSGRNEVIWQREVCCQNVSHSFKMPVCVSATILCFDIIHPLARKPAQLLSPTPLEEIKNPFNVVVSSCDTDKMSTKDWKGGGKYVICHFHLEWLKQSDGKT